MQSALSRSQMTQEDKQDSVINKEEEKTSAKKETLMCELKKRQCFPIYREHQSTDEDKCI